MGANLHKILELQPYRPKKEKRKSHYQPHFPRIRRPPQIFDRINKIYMKNKNPVNLVRSALPPGSSQNPVKNKEREMNHVNLVNLV